MITHHFHAYKQEINSHIGIVSVMNAVGPTPASLLAKTEKSRGIQFSDASLGNLMNVLLVWPKEISVIVGVYVTTTPLKVSAGATQLNISCVVPSESGSRLSPVGIEGESTQSTKYSCLCNQSCTVCAGRAVQWTLGYPALNYPAWEIITFWVCINFNYIEFASSAIENVLTLFTIRIDKKGGDVRITEVPLYSVCMQRCTACARNRFLQRRGHATANYQNVGCNFFEKVRFVWFPGKPQILNE